MNKILYICLLIISFKAGQEYEQRLKCISFGKKWDIDLGRCETVALMSYDVVVKIQNEKQKEAYDHLIKAGILSPEDQDDQEEHNQFQPINKSSALRF
nr:hypothetical protein BHI3_07860 [Bacteriovorax sp. HI3]